jgi:opacity protein-like surface antigen
MKKWLPVVTVIALGLPGPVCGAELSGWSPGWRTRFDIGGSIPVNPSLSEIGGPITGGSEMKLSAGMQFDVAVGYQFTPWLTLEAEIGDTFNSVDAVGNWSYPDSDLAQLTLMANVVLEPPTGPLVPFVGIGGGGVYSRLSFGNYYSYYYSECDGYGNDFVPAAQAFAGVRYDFNKDWSLGVTYRFLATAEQNWDVEWWNGNHFRVGVDAVCIHAVCLSLNARF